MLHIELWLKEAAEPKRYRVEQTFFEGPFLCLQLSASIHKYPVDDIYRVIERKA